MAKYQFLSTLPRYTVNLSGIQISGKCKFRLSRFQTCTNGSDFGQKIFVRLSNGLDFRRLVFGSNIIPILGQKARQFYMQ